MMPGIIISLIFSEQGKLVVRATPLQLPAAENLHKTRHYAE